MPLQAHFIWLTENHRSVIPELNDPYKSESFTLQYMYVCTYVFIWKLFLRHNLNTETTFTDCTSWSDVFIIWWIVKWTISFRWVYCAVRHIVSISLLSESNTSKLHFQRHFPICVDLTVAFADAHVEFRCTFRLNKCHIALFLHWKKYSVWMKVFLVRRCCEIVWFDLKT